MIVAAVETIDAVSAAPTLTVTVTIPADAGDISKPVPKSIVPAVPTTLPESLTSIPVPEAVTPISPDPSPTNLVAVTTPVTSIPPVVVCNLRLPSLYKYAIPLLNHAALASVS